MKKIALYAVVAALCGSVVSCNKKDNNQVVNQYYKSYPTLDSVFGLLSVKSQFFNIDAATGGSFYGAKGTRFIISPNSLQDGAGASVTGQVQIEVAEYMKRGDMIFSGVLPYSDGEPLVSGGEIYINATQSGQPVYLKPGFTFRANVPRNGDTTKGFVFFAGRQGPNAVENKVNWGLPNTDTVSGRVAYIAPIVNPLTRLEDSLGIVSDSFQYCNPDFYYRTPTDLVTYEMTISTSGKYLTSQRNMRAFMLDDKVNTIITTKNATTSDANVTFSCTSPLNYKINHVAFALIDNHFYGGILTFTPIAGAKYSLTLTEVDPVAFKGQINAFYK